MCKIRCCLGLLTKCGPSGTPVPTFIVDLSCTKNCELCLCSTLWRDDISFCGLFIFHFMGYIYFLIWLLLLLQNNSVWTNKQVDGLYLFFQQATRCPCRDRRPRRSEKHVLLIIRHFSLSETFGNSNQNNTSKQKCKVRGAKNTWCRKRRSLH